MPQCFTINYSVCCVPTIVGPINQPLSANVPLNCPVVRPSSGFPHEAAQLNIPKLLAFIPMYPQVAGNAAHLTRILSGEKDLKKIKANL